MRGWWVGIAEMLLAHAALSSGVGRGFNRWGERSTDSAAFLGGKDRVPFPRYPSPWC
jgi:hypothetical protein